MAEPPICPTNPTHGPMVARPLDRQSPEQRWCGDWWDCAHVQPWPCRSSSLDPSLELDAQLAEQRQAYERSRAQQALNLGGAPASRAKAKRTRKRRIGGVPPTHLPDPDPAAVGVTTNNAHGTTPAAPAPSLLGLRADPAAAEDERL